MTDNRVVRDFTDAMDLDTGADTLVDTNMVDSDTGVDIDSGTIKGSSIGVELGNKLCFLHVHPEKYI